MNSVSDARRASGFVLAVTLWMLAGIAIAVGALTLWAMAELADATGARERTEDALAMASTRETVLYLLATRDLTFAGLPVESLDEEARALRLVSEMAGMTREPRGGELALDGTRYRGIGETGFAIQDEAGLFSIAWPVDGGLDVFLDERGVSSRDVPALRDALLDYVDVDDLRRLNGAESREYERAGLPVPPNRRLLLPHEVFDVMGWDALREGGDHRVSAEELTTAYLGPANLNTAPPSLLPYWLPDCPRICDEFLRRRERKPWESGQEVEAILGIQLRGDETTDYRTVAGEDYRLTVWGRSGVPQRIHVRLTPTQGGAGPWSVLATYPISRRGDEPIQDTGSDLFADLPGGPTRR